MPMHDYSIYTDLYLDRNNCRRGMLKFKDWEAAQILYTLCLFLSSCLHSTTPDDLSPALQTDPDEGSQTVRCFFHARTCLCLAAMWSLTAGALAVLVLLSRRHRLFRGARAKASLGERSVAGAVPRRVSLTYSAPWLAGIIRLSGLQLLCGGCQQGCQYNTP